jgi:hypothetical protein
METRRKHLGLDDWEAEKRRCAGDYLLRIRDAKRAISAMNAEIEEQRALASGLAGIDYSRPAVDAPPNADRTPDAVARLMEIVEERIALVREYVERLDECGARLAELQAEDATYASILRYRYLCDWPWERIAAETHYSEQWLYELHNRALLAFYGKLPAHERIRTPRAI